MYYRPSISVYYFWKNDLKLINLHFMLGRYKNNLNDENSMSKGGGCGSLLSSPDVVIVE